MAYKNKEHDLCTQVDIPDVSYSRVGRPAAFRWPGLERLKDRVEESGAFFFPRTRMEELMLAVEEAVIREGQYQDDTTNDGVKNSPAAQDQIEIDFDALRFDVGPDGAHTTIDFGKINDASELATITTNDFIVFNRIKKVLFDEESGAAASERGWSITDLKLNQPQTALFFVTVTVPVGELKKIFNKYQ